MVSLQALKQRFEIIGNSVGLNRALEKAMQVAPTDISVLITGESGVGKEVIPKIAHQLSHRKHSKFIAVNCGAIPEGTIDSELFGHEKGAFTGAHQQRKGKFEQANGGTLFLDEIGDMPLDAQSKLLRVLQEQEITRIGGSKKIKIDVRVLAATNKNLEEEITEGRFREDLYHRISVIPIEIPPLDNRKEDIPAIAEAWLKKLHNDDISLASSTLMADGLLALQKRTWSGNVRELQNAIERLSILSMDGNIDNELVDSVLKSSQKNASLVDFTHGEDDFQRYKEATERIFLERQLQKNDWNISKTAEAIGLQRSHVYNKKKKYNIER